VLVPRIDIVFLVVLLGAGSVVADSPPIIAATDAVRWGVAVAMAVAPPTIARSATPRPDPLFTPLFDRLRDSARVEAMAIRCAARLRSGSRRRGRRRRAVSGLPSEHPDDH
jgi:hypothetical protein